MQMQEHFNRVQLVADQLLSTYSHRRSVNSFVLRMYLKIKMFCCGILKVIFYSSYQWDRAAGRWVHCLVMFEEIQCHTALLWQLSPVSSTLSTFLGWMRRLCQILWFPFGWRLCWLCCQRRVRRLVVLCPHLSGGIWSPRSICNATLIKAWSA